MSSNKYPQQQPKQTFQQPNQITAKPVASPFLRTSSSLSNNSPTTTRSQLYVVRFKRQCGDFILHNSLLHSAMKINLGVGSMVLVSGDEEGQSDLGVVDSVVPLTP
eukprot:gene36773-45366_t